MESAFASQAVIVIWELAEFIAKFVLYPQSVSCGLQKRCVIPRFAQNDDGFGVFAVGERAGIVALQAKMQVLRLRLLR
jgi:hypothetical protein